MRQNEKNNNNCLFNLWCSLQDIEKFLNCLFKYKKCKDLYKFLRPHNK